jgi:MoaA/NifB/PqqE/SkfB family radical SAM enzyme
VHRTQIEFIGEDLAKIRRYDWYNRPEIWEEFRARLPDLKQLHFAGGEPLLVSEMGDFLQACVDEGLAGGIDLSYNTNLTVVPDRLKKIWPRFRAVKLMVSIDAFGALNEYIRHPSRWSVIDRNLRDVDVGFREYGLTEVFLATTVQVYNVLHLRELYDYLLQFQNIARLPHLTDLHFPDHYRTQILPSEVKIEAQRRLTEILRISEQRFAEGLIPAEQARFIGDLRSSINFMIMTDLSGLLPEFRRVAESKDRLRGQDVYSFLPELRGLCP